MQCTETNGVTESVAAMSLQSNGASATDGSDKNGTEDSPVFEKYRSPESLRFLHGVCTKDPRQREEALHSVVKTFDSWIEGYGSPIESSGNNTDNDQLSTNFTAMIRERIPDILKLTRQCPFPDVRERCTIILKDLKERGIKVPRRKVQGPSEFITDKEVVPVDSEDVETHNLFVDAFLHNNRLEHMVQVMGYHPQYLECFLKTQQYMLRGDGPLPYDYRHYIAIMAASRHQCSYLVNSQITEFLNQGGDERWLKGLDHIPKKLRDLSEINKILAHRPWLINKGHIEKLLRGQENWSVGELIHAIVLLAHFHGLASFVYGCGINAEINHPAGHTFRPSSLSDSSSPSSSSPSSQPGTPNSASDIEGGIEALMERMRKLTEEEPEEMTQEELLKRFEKVEAQSSELPAASNKPSPHAEILRFIDDEEFTYEDFAKRGAPGDIPTFRAQDYSWEDQGFSLCNRLYSDIGTLLDDKFRVAYNLTYYTMGDNTDVDTSSFRRAIWYYIHCMFGIRHDDYDYSEVNQLLERNLKAYIKTVTCYPERVTRRDYDSFMREFKPSEKVHVNLMMLEARIQAGLLYALRALMRYMT